MPSFEKAPPDLLARFSELAETIPDGARRAMFGYPAVTINGHLCFSVHENHAILRLPEADQKDFGAAHRLQLFEPMPGRPMREYVVIPDLLAGPGVQQWIERSAAYVRGLPPKPTRRRSTAGGR